MPLFPHKPFDSSPSPSRKALVLTFLTRASAAFYNLVPVDLLNHQPQPCLCTTKLPMPRYVLNLPMWACFLYLNHHFHLCFKVLFFLVLGTELKALHLKIHFYFTIQHGSYLLPEPSLTSLIHNPSTWEAEAGWWQVWGHPGLHSETLFVHFPFHLRLWVYLGAGGSHL
jgi:hypothetical protein